MRMDGVLAGSCGGRISSGATTLCHRSYHVSITRAGGWQGAEGGPKKSKNVASPSLTLNPRVT